MKNTPNATPVKKAPSAFTDPKYSGAKKSASAPKFFINWLLSVLIRIYQKTRSIWYFLKCNKNSCTGKKKYIFLSVAFISVDT
jgi:hypothetical protein